MVFFLMLLPRYVFFNPPIIRSEMVKHGQKWLNMVKNGKISLKTKKEKRTIVKKDGQKWSDMVKIVKNGQPW